MNRKKSNPDTNRRKQKPKRLETLVEIGLQAELVAKVEEEFDHLAGAVRDRLLGAFGTRREVAGSVVRRYGEQAVAVFAGNCVRLEPADPLIHVDIPTGRIAYDHLDEFYACGGWGFHQPRPGSLMAVLKGLPDYHPPRMPRVVAEALLEAEIDGAR